MENHTAVEYFRLLLFSNNPVDKWWTFSVFFLIYCLGVIINMTIITATCLERFLHTPLYLFLSNLSFVDICYTTVIIPKLLDMILSGNFTMSSMQCFTQLFFFITVAGIEEILLFIMAIDRYVAICNPLHYHQILSWKNCTLITVCAWVLSFLNSLLFTKSAAHMSFCGSNIIQQFFCDAKAMTKIACGDNYLFYAVLGIEFLFFGLVPFICSLASYIKIIRVILKIKSAEGRKKAFSTCSSHLTVLSMYYGTASSVYLKPSSDNSLTLEQVFTILYTTITPMLNPLVYSIRNKDIKASLKKLIGTNYFFLKRF
ncbi:olfactory receptor 1-like [Rana temporaria]|uniref:olfactory receptor 1-like n=1 Tax=Rana temporaria TaxID=8407 RepID=UPI001AACD7B8|nr:olfactory receptor 1-like [Rana temporaria]